mmetsp:Transcript_2347/g.3484  ORF Transcript_2347/g.3484 Transcript_2347/m.3484 type:complete len:112 (+) Transcript_2347:62-397(+)
MRLLQARFGGSRLASTASIKPRYMLIYDYVEDVLEKRAPHRAGHLSLIEGYVKDGKILMAGALSNPPDKAFIVATSEEAAKTFSEEDPYVKNGVVTGVSIREWNTVEFSEQ